MNQSTIPTPAKYQLRRAAARGLPTVFFVVVCGLSALLWQFQNRSSVFVGEVEVMEYLVASPQQGVVSQLIPSDGAELDVYVTVKKDQLLIQLDDSATRKQLELLQKDLLTVSSDVSKELGRLNAMNSVALREIAIKLDDSEKDTGNNTVVQPSVEETIWRETQSLVDQSLAAVEIVQKQLDLRQIDFELGQATFEQKARGGDPGMLEQYRNQRKAVADEIYELKTSIEADRIAALSKIDKESLPPTSRLLFGSLTNRVRAAETKLALTNQSASKLDIVSPVDGQIEESMVQRTQAVTGGQPLLTVVPQRGTMVVVYAREQSLMRPFAGMRVTLQSRTNPNQMVESAVEAVGPKVEVIPARHRLNPKIVEWGRPMRIRIPDAWVVEPGSLLDVIVDQP